MEKKGQAKPRPAYYGILGRSGPKAGAQKTAGLADAFVRAS